MYSAFQISLLLAVLTLCTGMLSQCMSEQDRNNSLRCFEQTKNIKCWELK